MSKNNSCARDVAQHVIALAALSEDQSSGPNICIRQPTTTCNSSFMKLDALCKQLQPNQRQISQMW